MLLSLQVGPLQAPKPFFMILTWGNPAGSSPKGLTEISFKWTGVGNLGIIIYVCMYIQTTAPSRQGDQVKLGFPCLSVLVRKKSARISIPKYSIYRAAAPSRRPAGGWAPRVRKTRQGRRLLGPNWQCQSTIRQLSYEQIHRSPK